MFAVFNMSTGGDEEASSLSSSPQEHSSSALNNMAADFRSALDEFRENWQKEIKNTESMPEPTSAAKTATQEATDLLTSLPLHANEDDKQQFAFQLFSKAVELEQKGKVYDAVPLYRKAVQMFPDIEFKYYDQQKSLKAPSKANTTETNLSQQTQEINNEDFIDDLYEKFQMDITQNYEGRLILSSREAGVISTEMHISELPTEILFYILRWVVSNQLDMHSLEQCAAVCKGLYLCCRDEELWRLACIK